MRLSPLPLPLPLPSSLQYNTCFWAIVKSGKTAAQAHEQLRVRLPIVSAQLPRTLLHARLFAVAAAVDHSPTNCPSQPPLHRTLQGTLSDYKNELLFSQFGLNYSMLPERFRKVGAAQLVLL